jgi:polyphosphate kinase
MDFSLLTCDVAITASVNDVFKFLTAYAEQPNYKPLLVAPRDLAKGCIALIDREARNLKRGRPPRIIAKMNALVDPPVIQALCRASQAGVEIDLIVRGQCALLPGLRGVSSRIRVLATRVRRDCWAQTETSGVRAQTVTATEFRYRNN